MRHHRTSRHAVELGITALRSGYGLLPSRVGPVKFDHKFGLPVFYSDPQKYEAILGDERTTIHHDRNRAPSLLRDVAHATVPLHQACHHTFPYIAVPHRLRTLVLFVFTTTMFKFLES